MLTSSFSHTDPLLSLPIEYDCYRAASYKYFGITPRYTNPNFIITSLLYTQEPSRNLSSVVKQPRVKTREYRAEEMSMRELVVLFCNSDVVIRNEVDDDVFSLFLLPRNGYVEMGEGREKSWTERNAELMRIVFCKAKEVGVVREVMKEVRERKYGWGCLLDICDNRVASFAGRGRFIHNRNEAVTCSTVLNTGIGGQCVRGSENVFCLSNNHSYGDVC